MSDIEFHYVSNRTVDNDINKNIINNNPHVLHSYEVIKKGIIIGVFFYEIKKK